MITACATGVLTPLLLSLFRFHKSEALGIAVLFALSMNYSRETVLVYTMSLTISMYFYDVYSEQIVNLRKKLILTVIFLTAGTIINFSGSFIAAGALHMYSGGTLVCYIAVLITYIAAMKTKKAETAAGLLTGIAFYYILDAIHTHTTEFTLENTYYIFIIGLLILPKIYTGKFYTESTVYLSASIFIALPLMFMSSVPINFSSSLLMGAYNNSNIITGGYNSISTDHFRHLFSTYFYLSTLLSILIAYIYIKLSTKKPSLFRYIPVRFGRPLIIVLALTCLQSQDSTFLELLLTAVIGLAGFLLYKWEICPETVFMGYIFSSVIQNESIKTGILSSETGIMNYLGSIPLTGIITIVFIATASYLSGKYVGRHESSLHR